MPLPGPGVALSLDNIGTEFTAAGAGRPHQISEFYRGGGIVGNYAANSSVPTSGTIAIGDFYNASGRNAYTISISSNVNNYNAYNSRSPNYVAGFSDITYDISPGVVIGSTSTTTGAFIVPNQFNGNDTIFIRNRGTILGRGGAGGPGGPSLNASTPQYFPGSNGSNGVVGMQFFRPVTINNQGGTISGGGGGGGGGGAAATPSFFQPPSGYTPAVFYPQSLAGGGGGGGGRGSGFGGSAGLTPGPPSTDGANGGAGTATTNGGGGAGGSQPSPWGGGTATAGAGGAGGGLGANGTNGQGPPSSPTGQKSGGTRGAGGSATQNAPQYVTWQATGSRFGPIG